MLTPTHSRTAARRALVAISLTAVAGLVVTACGGSTGSAGTPGNYGATTAATGS
jgi:hypothetical protein